jgi:hypothetical protein
MIYDNLMVVEHGGAYRLSPEDRSRPEVPVGRPSPQSPLP